MDVFKIPTTVEVSSPGTVRQPSAEVAPAGVGEVKTVSNPPTTPVPFWGAPAVRPSAQPGAKPVYANEWSVANPQKVAQYEQASGVPKVTPTPADPSQKKDDTVQVGAIAVATGAGMVHIPVGPKEEPPATTTDEDKPRRSTILALTQMSSGKEMEDHRTTATSVAPGAFLVNQDYFEERVPPVAESAQANKGKASWADAEEDYFYFGKQQVDEPVTSIPAEKPSSGEQSSSPRTVVRQYPAYTVSPPIGSTLASQNVNAQKKRTPSAKKASSKTSSAPTSLTTHRQTISSQSKMRPPGTAREIEKSHLTPGERKILEARERLSRKVK
ncbi:hypothetical protein AGDE_12674 [Angomonas deanei]|nr:hypothetical protein AGDE_12674 [Angomonas deanei]|eukprot:EPY23871.1 hypothetical protein AGDE_12674 [Angomonas deanei]